MNRFIICHVESTVARKILVKHAAAAGWRAEQSEFNMNGAAVNPARDPFFFLDYVHREYGFAMGGSVVHEQGDSVGLEDMLDRAHASPPPWNFHEQQLADGIRGEIHATGNVVLRVKLPPHDFSLFIRRENFEKFCADHNKLRNQFTNP
jgi:hypothetical protein